MKPNRFFIIAMAMTIAGAVPAGAGDRAHELEASTAKLNDEWQKHKVDYKNRYKSQLESIDKEIKTLEGQLDHGDAKERNRINEDLADLRRLRVDITQVFNEITASSAVKWGNVPGDIKDAVDDMKD